jgi:hypothetical protein
VTQKTLGRVNGFLLAQAYQNCVGGTKDCVSCTIHSSTTVLALRSTTFLVNCGKIASHHVFCWQKWQLQVLTSGTSVYHIVVLCLLSSRLDGGDNLEMETYRHMVVMLELTM